MNTPTTTATDRRQLAGAAPATEHNLQNDVRKALALRERVGVIAAIEYLKTVGADSVLIERVLFNGAVREGDRNQAPRGANTQRRWTLRAVAAV
jgi:hypothetical protein